MLLPLLLNSFGISSIGRDVAKTLQPIFAWSLNSSSMSRERTLSVPEHSSRASMMMKALGQFAITEYNALEISSKEGRVRSLS
jgi:hypothetical protein